MFFHTNEEKYTALVHGITSEFGVTLINRDHPFPLLVEEEERMHGALLANTTHGALFRTFGCINDVQNIPIFLKFNHRNVKEIPTAQKVLNMAQFHRDQMALDSIQCHEGFAKHIAYAFQFQFVNDKQFLKLKERLAKDRKAYKLLDSLCKKFVNPAEKGAYELSCKFGYQAAKAVLNTKDLSTILLNADPVVLWNNLQTGRFASELESRANVAINSLEDFISRFRNSNELAKALVAPENKLYDIVASQLNNEGFDTEDSKTPDWLIVQAALLGKRIGTITEGVYCSENANFIGWTYNNGRVDIDERFLSDKGNILVSDAYNTLQSVINSDPALSVFYLPKQRGEKWSFGHVDDIDATKWDKLAIYVTPAFEKTGEPAKKYDSDNHNLTLTFHFYCFGLTSAGPKSFIVTYVDWWKEEERLAAFSDDNLVLLSREPLIPGPTSSKAPVEELATLLGKHAQVVYWKTVASPSILIDKNSFTYESNGEQKIRGYPNDRGHCAVINKRSNHTVLTCVPKYVIQIVHNATRHWFDGRLKELAKILQPIEELKKWSSGAKLAYNLMYEHEILPDELPYFDGLELYYFLNSNV